MVQLSLNLQKTVLISFWPDKTSAPIKLPGFNIPQVTSTKFLGVQIDDTLHWQQQISNIHNKLTANKTSSESKQAPTDDRLTPQDLLCPFS